MLQSGKNLLKNPEQMRARVTGVAAIRIRESWYVEEVGL